jgi:hypothetical protein
MKGLHNRWINEYFNSSQFGEKELQSLMGFQEQMAEGRKDFFQEGLMKEKWCLFALIQMHNWSYRESFHLRPPILATSLG